MDTVEELNGTYFYKGYTQLTPQQLWWLITVDALREHLGDQRCRCRPDRIRTTLASHAPKAGDCHTRHVNGSVALRRRQVTCCFLIFPTYESDPKSLQTFALSRRYYCSVCPLVSGLLTESA